MTVDLMAARDAVLGEVRIDMSGERSHGRSTGEYPARIRHETR